MRLSSPYDGHGRGGLRVLLACVLAFDTLLVSWFLLHVHAGPASHPLAPAWLLAFAGNASLVAPVAAVALLSLAAFARRPAQRVPGFVALGAVGLLVEAHAASIEGPYRIFFAGGAALLGWLIAGAYARALHLPTPETERYAELGAAACLAATYVDAFASKMMAGGLGWTGADSLRAVVLTQHAVNSSSFSSLYASAIADHAWLARTLVTLTLLAQASALAFPWDRRARAVSGSLLLAFHANTALVTPLFFPEAMALLIGLSYPWPSLAHALRGRPPAPASRAPASRASSAVTRDEVSPRPARPARVALVAGLLSLCALAWTSPLRSYTLAQHRHAGGPRPAPALPVAPETARVLGDLAPGAHVGGWQVRSVAGLPSGARLDLTNGSRVLHVLVVPHGAMPADPPARTRGYDLFYDRPHPGEATADDAEIASILEAVAGAIRPKE